MKSWRNQFRLILLGIFIIGSGIVINSLGSYNDKMSSVGAGFIAATSLICLTLVELYLWKEKDNRK